MRIGGVDYQPKTRLLDAHAPGQQHMMPQGHEHDAQREWHALPHSIYEHQQHQQHQQQRHVQNLRVLQQQQQQQQQGGVMMPQRAAGVSMQPRPVPGPNLAQKPMFVEDDSDEDDEVVDLGAFGVGAGGGAAVIHQVHGRFGHVPAHCARTQLMLVTVC